MRVLPVNFNQNTESNNKSQNVNFGMKTSVAVANRLKEFVTHPYTTASDKFHYAEDLVTELERSKSVNDCHF